MRTEGEVWMTIKEWVKDFKSYVNALDIQRDDYNGIMEYIDDALDFLKEQKHSETFIVIDNKTGKEADTYDIALHEDWAKHLCYCDMEGWAIEEDGTLLLVDECGRFAYADRERFKVKWE